MGYEEEEKSKEEEKEMKKEEKGEKGVEIQEKEEQSLNEAKLDWNNKNEEEFEETDEEICKRPKKKKELCLSFLKVKTLSATRFFFFSQKRLCGCGNAPYFFFYCIFRQLFLFFRGRSTAVF